MDDNEHINPYAAPTEPPAAPTVELPEISVDGDLLVVASGATLPPRCIKSNDALTDRDVVQQKLFWRKKTFQHAFIAPECELTLYVKPVYRVSTWSGLIPILLPSFIFGLHILGIAVVGLPILIGTTVVALSVWIALANKTGLHVVHFERDRFWIQGCGPKFLESLQRELAEEE